MTLNDLEWSFYIEYAGTCRIYVVAVQNNDMSIIISGRNVVYDLLVSGDLICLVIYGVPWRGSTKQE